MEGAEAGLSEYELQRLAHIRRNQEYMRRVLAGARRETESRPLRRAHLLHRDGGQFVLEHALSLGEQLLVQGD